LLVCIASAETTVFRPAKISNAREAFSAVLSSAVRLARKIYVLSRIRVLELVALGQKEGDRGDISAVPRSYRACHQINIDHAPSRALGMTSRSPDKAGALAAVPEVTVDKAKAG
jgi:hypothetical protein